MNKGMWKRNLRRGAALALTLVMSLSIAARGAAQERLAAQAAGIALFNLDVIHALPSVDWNKGEKKTGRLFKSTSFLFWTFTCSPLPNMPLTPG